MFTPEVFECRSEDYSLTLEQQALADSFAALAQRMSPTSRVRQISPRGFDAELWTQLRHQGLFEMATPAGDGGASWLELALIGEELGAAMAVVPFSEAVVAARLLHSIDDGLAQEFRNDAAHGDEPVVFDPRGAVLQGGLTATGAISRRFVVVGEESVILIETEQPGALVANSAGLALARPTAVIRREELPASSSILREARAGSQVLAASRLVGLARSALTMSLDFARERKTRGLAIGALQGVAFPLADVHIGCQTARHLVHRAAWYVEDENRGHTELAPAALVHAGRVARHAAEVGVHTHGGQGVSLESDITLVFSRAQAWALAEATPRDLVRSIANIVIPHTRQEAVA